MRSQFLSRQPRLESVLQGTDRIQQGDQDRVAVSLLQMALAVTGKKFPRSTLPHGMLDGIFGGETDAAVRGFQAERSLTVDGVVGRNTLFNIDALLAGIPLLPAPPNPHAAKILLPPRVDSPRPLRPLKQPDPYSCWASCGTMLWEYKNPGLVTPQMANASATDRIVDVLKRADGKSVLGTSHFQNLFKQKTGLNGFESRPFYCDSLGFVSPMNNVVLAPGMLGWLSLLAMAQGPLIAHSIRVENGINNHAFMITGADSTRKMPSKVAPPLPLVGLEFLDMGVIKYFDSFAGVHGEMSVRDADSRLSVLPDWMPQSARLGERVFY